MNNLDSSSALFRRLRCLSLAAVLLVLGSCNSTESSLASRDARGSSSQGASTSFRPNPEFSAGGRFDPCQEIEHQAERTHLVWEGSHFGGRLAAEKRAVQLLNEAKVELAAATELHHRRAETALGLQEEERAYATRLAARANDFRSEVLLLSGLREHGSDRPPLPTEAPNWERFVVLDDPPANLWYEIDPSNRVTGERRRLTLQETMFTELPKYQERSSVAREELYIAREKAALALEAKQESAQVVLQVRKVWEGKRASLQRAREELREAQRSRKNYLEARASLEECRGDASPTRAWLQAQGDLNGVRSLTASLNEALDGGQDEIERLARPGYRAHAEEALAQARTQMGAVLRFERDALEALENAATWLIDREASEADLAKAVRETEIASEALRRLRIAADEIPTRIESSLGLACEAEERYFADSDFERTRRKIVEQRLYDSELMNRMRTMSPFESLNRHWDEMRLFDRLPEKLELWARGEHVDLSPELVEASISMARTFRQSFHPCEPHLGGSQTLERFQGSDGGAASRAELLRRAEELCQLLQRIETLMASAGN